METSATIPTKPTALRTIFIVDDDKFMLDIYSKKFSDCGFEVNTGFGGEDALSKLRAGYTPDVALLDVVMPGVDGIELLQAIRKEKLAPNAVILMFSNQGQESDIANAKKYDIQGYLIKANTTPSEVVTEVTKIIENYKH